MLRKENHSTTANFLKTRSTIKKKFLLDHSYKNTCKNYFSSQSQYKKYNLVNEHLNNNFNIDNYNEMQSAVIYEDIHSVEVDNQTSLIHLTIKDIMFFQLDGDKTPQSTVYQIRTSRACFHALYLRDNCKSNFDVNTGQRTVSTYDFFPTNTNIQFMSPELKGNEIQVHKSNKGKSRRASPSPINIIDTKVIDIFAPSESERENDDMLNIYTMPPLQRRGLEIVWGDQHRSQFSLTWLKNNVFNLELTATNFFQEKYNDRMTYISPTSTSIVDIQNKLKVLLESEKDIMEEMTASDLKIVKEKIKDQKAAHINRNVYDVKKYYWNKSRLQKQFPQFLDTGGIPKVSYESLFSIRIEEEEHFQKERNECNGTHLTEKALFKHLRDSGVVIIDGLSSFNDLEINDDLLDTQVIQIAKLLGNYPRTTHYGLTFDVKSEKKPAHLAYTSVALDFHTDLNYREKTPGIQLLHCLANSCVGGESTFVDGFHAATTLRKENPRAYHLLATTPIHFQVNDATACHSHKVPMIVCSQKQGSSELIEVHFNERTRGPITNIRPQEMEEFYYAMKLWSEIINRSENIVETKLKPGQMVIFNNRRIFHSRNSFDPSSGNRHLIGTYVEYDEFLSNLRKRNLHLPPSW